MAQLYLISEPSYKKSGKLITIWLAVIAFSFKANAVVDIQENTIKTLSLQQAIMQAQVNDPWLTGNRHQQQALESLSIAATTLPDPKISIGVANIAADTLSFQQEPMTQFTLGISQKFPRGDTLSLRNKQLKAESKQYPFLRQNRKAQIALTVGKLWLNAYKMQQSTLLIKQSKNLFEQN